MESNTCISTNQAQHFYLRKQSLSKLEIAICRPFILSPTAGVSRSVNQPVSLSVRKTVPSISNKIIYFKIGLVDNMSELKLAAELGFTYILLAKLFKVNIDVNPV